MSPKRIQLFLLLGICAITLHFSIRLGADCFRYFSLKKEGRAQIRQWETIAVKDRFSLKASYVFETQEKTWPGEFTLSPPYYLNEISALSAIKEKAKEAWTVWYNPKNPQISALEKSFPTGLLIRSLICYGVLVYFFCLYKRLVPV